MDWDKVKAEYISAYERANGVSPVIYESGEWVRIGSSLWSYRRGYIPALTENLKTRVAQSTNGERTMTSLQDKRPIEAIHSDIGQFSYAVGKDGITKITIYPDAGSSGYIARAAIWIGGPYGDEISERMDLHGCRIQYAVGARETTKPAAP